jgi:hypothetical protein
MLLSELVKRGQELLEREGDKEVIMHATLSSPALNERSSSLFDEVFNSTVETIHIETNHDFTEGCYRLDWRI